jgi:type III secretion system YscQ/HrcQ family protein
VTIWRPRPVDRLQVEARRRLARAAAAAARPLALPGLAALIRVSRAVVSLERIEVRPVASVERVVAIALRAGSGDRGAGAALVVPEALARELVDRALGRPASGGGSLTSGEEGALLYLLDRAGGDWIAAGGPWFRLCGVLADAAQVEDYLGEPAPWQVRARLTAGPLDGPLWLWSAAPSGEPSPARVPLHPESWPAPVTWRLVVGESMVASAELAALARGDVVVLDQLCHPLASTSQTAVRLVSGGVTRLARWLDRRRLELVSTGERRSPMDDRTEGVTNVTANLEDSIDPGVGAMEVRLQVEVGRVAIELEQALSLVAGSVIELDRDVGPGVQVRVGDRLVARGELVDCEGRLAVQITEVP